VPESISAGMNLQSLTTSSLVQIPAVQDQRIENYDERPTISLERDIKVESLLLDVPPEPIHTPSTPSETPDLLHGHMGAMRLQTSYLNVARSSRQMSHVTPSPRPVNHLMDAPKVWSFSTPPQTPTQGQKTLLKPATFLGTHTSPQMTSYQASPSMPSNTSLLTTTQALFINTTSPNDIQPSFQTNQDNRDITLEEDSSKKQKRSTPKRKKRSVKKQRSICNLTSLAILGLVISVGFNIYLSVYKT